MTYELNRDDLPDDTTPSRSGRSIATDGFSIQEHNLAQYFLRLKLIHRVGPNADADDAAGRWGSVISLLPVLPPGHFGTLADGLMPAEAIRHVERLTKKMRAAKADAVNGYDLDEIGPGALDLLRQLAVSLGTHRFYHGEDFVLALRLQRLLPDEPAAAGLELAQVLSQMQLRSVTPNDAEPTWFKRLVFVADYDPAVVTFEQRWDDRWRLARIAIERLFAATEPARYAEVEIRDRDGLTIARGELIGPEIEDSDDD